MSNTKTRMQGRVLQRRAAGEASGDSARRWRRVARPSTLTLVALVLGACADGTLDDEGGVDSVTPSTTSAGASPSSSDTTSSAETDSSDGESGLGVPDLGDDETTTGGTAEPEDSRRPYGGRLWGCAANGRGPGNTRYGRAAAHRFRAEHSGFVTHVRWNNRYDMPGGNVGYSLGDGGDVQVQLRSDDGTQQHFPAAQVLAETPVLEHMIEQPAYPQVALEAPVWLEEGTIYHIVYEQLDPGSGEVSINDLHNLGYADPKSPWFDDAFATLRYDDSGGWYVRDRYIPFFEIYYDDGVVKGQGYFGGRPEVDDIEGTVKTISGARRVRERIVGDDRELTVEAVWTRLWRVNGGDDPIDVCLVSEDGGQSHCVSVAASEITHAPEDQDAEDHPIPWFRLELPELHTIAPGTTHFFEMSAPASTTYRVTAMLGGAEHENLQMIEDKQVAAWRAEYSEDDGASWRGWTAWGVDDRDDHHLGVLLDLVADGQ